MEKENMKMSLSLPGGWLESGHGTIVVYVKDFRDPLERKKKLMLRPWASIKDIKDQLQVVFNVPTNAQKLFYQGRELKNAHNLQQCGIYQDNAIMDFVARKQQNIAMLYASESSPSSGGGGDSTTGSQISKSANVSGWASRQQAAAARIVGKPSENMRPEQMPMVNLHPYGAHLLPISLMKITHQALQGLAMGLAPVLAMDGTGGTYFLKDPSHRNVGCFKPQDEEPFGPNNPRGLVGELGQSGLRRGILSGEACERELAAYILDKDHFAGVPATSLVEARHPVFKYTDGSPLCFKMGSLQEFVRHDDVASDLAPSQFACHQVHKIVLLDMRLLNADRNDANILVRKKRCPTTNQIEYELIPIDHGYCLPQFLEIAWCDWCWYNWPQLKKPLSAEDRNYILSLNAQDEANILSKKIPFRRACRRNLIIAGMIVQKGVKANLVLFEIARIMCREDLDAPSILENICLEAFHELQRQRKLSEHPIATAVSAPASPRNKIHLKIDIPPSRDSFANGVNSPVNTGARSPPGFWASYAPFSADDDDEDDDYPDSVEKKTSRTDSISFSWDDMASNALCDAVKHVENGGKDESSINGSVSSNGIANHKAKKKDSPPSSAFAGENDKDEFEVLNDALDENVQDEKLFLAILGRIMDEKIEEVRRRQKEQSTNCRK